MVFNVLVVDDSNIFRNRLCEIINSDSELKVIGVAENGQEGVDKTLLLKPDVVTMDIDMPVLDGIAAVKKIMSLYPVPILMFSSRTTEGAHSTLEALAAGALDFLPKKVEDIATDFKMATKEIQVRIKSLAKINQQKKILMPQLNSIVKPKTFVLSSNSHYKKKKYKIILMGTSTGGPVALQKILLALPENFPVPIVMVQHMPETFTTSFAERLNSLCKIEVREAQNNDILKPGIAFLAPGGKQLIFENNGANIQIKINMSQENDRYKPCVDFSFKSAANIFAEKALGIVLTGMGSDGLEGARLLKARGSQMWVQDEASCVVFGMPGSIVEAGLADEVIELLSIPKKLISEII